MAATQPVPISLPRFTTEEEEIWFSSNSHLGDYMGPLVAISTPDAISTPGVTPTADDTNWLETTMESLGNGTPTVQIDVSTPTSAVQQDSQSDNQWPGITDFGIETVTARPVVNDADESNDTSAQTPIDGDAGMCMADPIDFGFFPNFEDVEQDSISDEEQKQEDLALDEEEAGAPQLKRVKCRDSCPDQPDAQNKSNSQTKAVIETRKSGRTRRRTPRVVKAKLVDTDNESKKTKKNGTRTNGRGRGSRGRTKNTSKKASENTPAPVSKKRNSSRSKSKAGDIEAQKRKREERLRRNRESANRSRIRKKKEMLELKQNVVVLRERVNVLNTRIEQLEEENENLRGKLQSYNTQASPFKPVVTVFALVFAVTFFAQSSALPGASLGTSVSGSTGKVLLSPLTNPSKFKGNGFLLAPILDLFPDSTINSFLSSGFLPVLVDIVTKFFVAFLLAALCAACFYYGRALRNNSKRKSDAVNGKTESGYTCERHPLALGEDEDNDFV